MKRTHKSTAGVPDGWHGLPQWRQENRAGLIEKFGKRFGSKLDEWPDFVEGEFAAHLRRGSKNC